MLPHKHAHNPLSIISGAEKHANKGAVAIVAVALIRTTLHCGQNTTNKHKYVHASRRVANRTGINHKTRVR